MGLKHAQAHQTLHHLFSRLIRRDIAATTLRSMIEIYTEARFRKVKMALAISRK